MPEQIGFVLRQNRFVPKQNGFAVLWKVFALLLNDSVTVWKAFALVWKGFVPVWKGFALVWKGFALVWKGFALVWKGFALVWKGFGLVWKGFALVWKGFALVWKGFALVWKGFAILPKCSLFHYDQLNRLTSAEHFFDLATNTLGATANPTVDESDHYSSYIYDSNGNIMALHRNGDGGSTTNPMDRLTYTYSGTDNRLQRVDDQVVATACSTDVDAMTTDFTYYRNGNLQNDPGANIALMLWHPNGKLNAIIREGTNDLPTLIFSYDGLGNRVRKVQVARDASGNTLPMSEWDLTYYIRDAQGNHITTIERDFTDTDEFEATDELNITETILYGSDRLGSRGWEPSDDGQPASLIGRQAFTHSGASTEGEYTAITPSGSPVYSTAPEGYFSSLEGAKHYELKNHLGNVLATVSDKRDVEVDGSFEVQNYTAKISDVSFYYPFGSLMPGLSDFGGGHRFGFGGHEKVDEVKGNGNIADMGDRWLDTRLGRTSKMDAKGNMYPGISPYSFAANNPLYFVDPDGMVLILSGKDAVKDIYSIVDPIYHSRITVTDDGQVHVDLSSKHGDFREVSVDAGLEVLYSLATANENYLYQVADKIDRRRPSDGYRKTLDLTTDNGIDNWSVTPDEPLNKSQWERWTEEGPPVNKAYRPVVDESQRTFQGIVSIAATGSFTDNGGEKRSAVVFHELKENFERTTNKLPRHIPLFKPDGSARMQDGVNSIPDDSFNGAHKVANRAEARLYNKSMNPGSAEYKKSE